MVTRAIDPKERSHAVVRHDGKNDLLHSRANPACRDRALRLQANCAIGRDELRTWRQRFELRPRIRPREVAASCRTLTRRPTDRELSAVHYHDIALLDLSALECLLRFLLGLELRRILDAPALPFFVQRDFNGACVIDIALALAIEFRCAGEEPLLQLSLTPVQSGD